MLRFSLRTMAIGVTLIALACGALINANVWIAGTAWTVVFLMLSVATIAALSRTFRGFWMGFSVMGWLYVLAVLGPFAGRLDGLLLTTMALNRATAAMPQANVVNQSSTAQATLLDVYSGLRSPFTAASMSNPSDGGFSQCFVQTGQAFWTLLLALVGGAVGAALARRRQAPRAVDAATPPARSTLN